MLYTDNELKNAIINNNFKDIQKHMDKHFRYLKKENKYTRTLHLIDTNNISLYRAHKPDKNGDDLTNIRPIIKFVNEFKRAKYGFEAGRYHVTYRVDIPIIYESKYYGVLEYSVDPTLFIDDMSSVSNYLESAILVKKRQYMNYDLNYYKKNLNIINVSENYLLFDDSEIFKVLDLEKIKIDDHFKYNNEYFTPYEYNLLNFKGTPEGKILIAVNISADENMFLDSIKLSAINQIVLIILIFIIVYYAFNYYETKIKNLIEHEKQNERLLHQQSKMASMGEMIGNIAHQWRQPLSIISTTASGIKIEQEYDIFNIDTLEKSMDNIIEQTSYMSKTIDDFRNFFKSDNEKVTFSFNDVLEQNLTLIHSTYANNYIEVIKSFDTNVSITGFQSELTQSILNILNNSKDQLIENNEQSQRVVKIETKIDNDNILLMITDNAGGIPKEILNKIFEPYFTTKHQSQGTGIGLFMTHEIIKKHFNGDIVASNTDIEYQDKIYKGAKITITIPLKKEL
ncbi:MAG: ATP-binding protein [Campylobacterota bacterium]|nr:ATP-binding protein [Campylobacterota bacterium]